ncbi:MAG: peptidylprolyl isomerase, partial [Lachnospiraceae bacterium]|nr:peptidylprolyl isomerase [Lachnospiraceae bacterium]
MKRSKWLWKERAALAAASVLLLSGCSVAETLTPVGKGEKEYGKAETMVILSTERLRYEQVYTNALWDAAVDHRGTTFESVLLSQVHDFMIELRTMSNMAAEQKIELTSREKDLVKEAAAQYFDLLGSNMVAEFDLTEEDVRTLYADYWTAEKLVEQLTGSINLEVSDSEAKVIEVAQIELSAMEEAVEVLEKVTEEGADFYTVAKEYSESDEVKMQLTYGLM